MVTAIDEYEAQVVVPDVPLQSSSEVAAVPGPSVSAPGVSGAACTEMDGSSGNEIVGKPCTEHGAAPLFETVIVSAVDDGGDTEMTRSEVVHSCGALEPVAVPGVGLRWCVDGAE